MGFPESIAATVALFLFIFIGTLLVITERPIYAVLILALGGSLFMPSGAGFDFPVIPFLGSRNLPYLILGLGIVLVWPHKLRGVELGRWPDWFVLVLSLLPIVTAKLNSDVVIWGPRSLHGLTTWDGLSSGFHALLDVGLPYMVGRVLFQSATDLRRLFIWIAGAGLIYSLLALVEMRLSPQLHFWVYGYHAFEVRFSMRWGGYRPMVFMDNGLALGLFMMITTVTAFALGRARINIGFFPSRFAGPYLLIILIMCKSVAAIIYGLLLTPVVALMRPKFVHWAAIGLAAVVLGYPVLRMQGLVSTTAVVELVESTMSSQRASSIKTRFDNEDRMLAHNWERFFFGWAAFGRNRVYNERTGVDITLTDGQWMILLSVGGLARWVCFYALLLWPIFLGLWRLPLIRGPDQHLVACLLLLVSIFALDHLLNGFFFNLPFLFSGAAVTLLRLLPRQEDRASENFPPGSRKEVKVRSTSSQASLSGAILGPRHRS